MNLECMRHTNTILISFDIHRARKLLVMCDMIFGGRENYDWCINDIDSNRPKITVVWNGVSIDFSCYRNI